MNTKNNKINKIIIFSLIFLIIGGIAGYFIGAASFKNNFNREGLPDFSNNMPNNNFQMNDSVKAEIESFFNSTSDITEINAYCKENPMYCMEYCRTINPSNEACSQLDFGDFGGEIPAK
jgi:hypothetical protein